MIRRIFPLVCSLVLVAGSDISLAARDQGAAPVRAQSFEPLPNVAVLATNSVIIENAQQADTQVTGNVIVNGPSTGPTLDPGADMDIAKNILIEGDIHAESAILNRNVTIDGRAFVTDLTLNTGAVIGDQLDYVAPVVDPLPPFKYAEIRTESVPVSVPPNTSDELEPGYYTDVTIENGATLTLVGCDSEDNVYHMTSLNAGASSTIIYTCPVDVRIQGRLLIGKNSMLIPDPEATLDGSAAIVYVEGDNSNPDNPLATPLAADVGKDSEIVANVYAPNGTLRYNKSVASSGMLIARDIWMNGPFITESAFINQPPVADPQTVFTSGDQNLEIILTGSDPEGADLTFSIVAGFEPVNGTIVSITPIVPAPVPEIDRETGLPTGNTIQPAITSAIAVYDPNGGGDVEDDFTFQVEDDFGKTGMAVVSINPLDTSPPTPGLDAVEAVDLELDVIVEATVEITLDAGAPPGDTLTYSILSLPTLGSLSALSGATVFYTAGSATGSDMFNFEACGSPSGTCDTATVLIGINPQVELAEDRSFSTELNVPVPFTLAGNSGGSGMPVIKSMKALPSAAVAGPVTDTDGDGFGDEAGIAGQFFGVDASTDALFSIDRDTGTKTIIGRLDAAATGGPNDAPNRYATPVSMATRPSDGTIFVRNNSELAGGNLLTNPDFDLDPTNPANGWTTVGDGALSHDLSFGQPAAPSAFAENFGGESLTLQQCVAITGGASFDFSARSFTDLSNGSSTNSVSVSFFSSGDCTTGFLSNVPSSSTTFPDWALRTASGVVSPATANSARIELAADSVGAGDTMDIHWDNVMLAVSGGGGLVSRNELVTVDPDTGAATSFGDNTAGNGALAVDPTNNQLYSVGGSIETIDVVGPSVNITFVANTGVSCANADFDSSGNLYCTTLGSPALYQINKSTGTATLIGALLDVTGAPFNRSDSIVFAPDGTLLGSGLNSAGGQVLFDIDPGTAAVSNVRTMNGLAQGMGFRDTNPEVMNAELASGQLEVRSQIEFDVGGLQFDPGTGDSATVVLTTRRIGDDSEDTQFYVGSGVQDGALSPSDFEAPAVILPGVLMPIPPGSQSGDEGTFSFDVTDELFTALVAQLDHFSVQGRVDDPQSGIGLGVFTTSSNSPPELVITGAPVVFFEIKITSLPTAGTVKDLTGTAVTVGQTFASATGLVFTPPVDTSGTFTLGYQVTENTLVDAGVFEFNVGIINNQCVIVGRPIGCTPD